MSPQDDREEAASGHYRTVGTALVGFGLACALFAGAVFALTPQDLGFIDTPSALAICAVMVFLGAAMVRHAET